MRKEQWKSNKNEKPMGEKNKRNYNRLKERKKYEKSERKGKRNEKRGR